MKKLKIVLLGIGITMGVGLFSRATAQVVTVRPEVTVVAAPGPAPYAGAVWVAGEYRWDPAAGKYIVVEGRWLRPHHVGMVWVPGHWRAARGGWVWVGGHWRR